MKEIGIKILEWIGQHDLYIALTGLIGTIIQSARAKMSFFDFFKLLLLSCFFGYAIFKTLLNYTDLPIDIIIIICCGFSGFSKVVFDELEEVLKNLSEFIITFINNKINK